MASPSVNVVSDSQLTAVSPPNTTGTVDITVTTPAGTSAVSATDKFSYPAASAPLSVTNVTPNNGTPGSSIFITGSGFTGATAVNFGPLPSPNFSVINDQTIQATAPSGAPGSVDVTVVTPSGTSTTNPADQFTYLAPLPPPTPASPSPGLASDGTQTSTASTPVPVTAPAPGLTSQGYYLDPALSSQLVGSIVDILKTASSPDAVEAQNTILRRLALEGDIVGSRIPPPKTISEVGGYVNLLTSLKEPAIRSQMLASLLGVAGPSQPLGWVSNNQPLAFVTLPNDRPAGRSQPALALTFVVRSDFSGALQAALNALHQQGCALPFSSPPVVMLPQAMPGTLPPADVLPYLGRTLDVATVAALVDPRNDPVALIRVSGTSAPFQIAAQVLTTGNVPVVPGIYDALQCDASSCLVVQVSGQYVLVAPILAVAGFYPTSPLSQPGSVTATAWARFTNITGLVPGVTKLGDELSLIYSWSSINHSVFASVLHWVWNGTAFT
jgi:hypothetical protein